MAPARSAAPPWTCWARVERSKSRRARMSLASLIQVFTEWDGTRARRTQPNKIMSVSSPHVSVASVRTTAVVNVHIPSPNNVVSSVVAPITDTEGVVERRHCIRQRA
jgi:hypothetical protein